MLEARSLTKYYNHTPAVRGVSFTIRPGEILGYLGPNGAGKSTTVKMLTGLIEPSEGQIFYQGRSVHEDFTAFQRRIGYVPEEAHLYPHLSGREYLQLMGRLRGMPRQILEPKMDEFLRAFALWDDRHSPLSAYSKGMRQKILLSAALLHDPDILILDEPFSGLDVTSALMLRTLLRALADRGKIILYSSHVLEVVEKICSTVLILRNGEVVAYDSIERLRELMSQPSLEGVFAQLAQVDDGEEVANRIVDAMSERRSTTPPSEPAGKNRTVRRTARRRTGKGRSLCASLARGLAGLHCRGSALAQFGDLHRDLRLQRDERDGFAQHSRCPAIRRSWSHCSYRRRTRATSVTAHTTTCFPRPWPMSRRCPSAFRWADGRSVSGATWLRTPTSRRSAFVRRWAGFWMSGPEAITPVVVSYRFWQEQLASDSIRHRQDDPREFADRHSCGSRAEGVSGRVAAALRSRPLDAAFGR